MNFRHAKKLESGKELYCPYCKDTISSEYWVIEHEPCETCGAHRYILCPMCGDGDENMPEEK